MQFLKRKFFILIFMLVSFVSFIQMISLRKIKKVKHKSSSHKTNDMKDNIKLDNNTIKASRKPSDKGGLNNNGKTVR